MVEIDAVSGAVTGSVPNATAPVWTPPIIDSHVIREWGADRVQTAVAASQLNFADHGATSDKRRIPAGAVVLSRSDTFADALGGSALAVRKNAPLLLTDPSGISPDVLDYLHSQSASLFALPLLGGPAALPNAIAAQGASVIGVPGDVRIDTFSSGGAFPYATKAAGADTGADELGAPAPSLSEEGRSVRSGHLTPMTRWRRRPSPGLGAGRLRRLT